MSCLIAGKKQCSSASTRRDRGFTLIELLSVVSIILILVSLLCAALNHTRDKAFRINCLGNLKQLQWAWAMYIDDNDSWLPLNQTAPAPVHHRIVSFRSSTNSWVVGNPLVDVNTANLKRGTLHPYLGSTDVYRCRMDSSTVHGHPDIPRTRSYSMNGFLGGDEGDPRVKFRMSELVNPRPENTFVFIEEHESSLWAANFIVPPPEKLLMRATSWVSTPADRHYRGCNLTFADGHVEFWRWYSAKQSPKENKLASTGKELRDIRRLQAVVPQLLD